MTTKAILTLFIALATTLSIASEGFSGHEEEKGAVKGTVTRIEATEYLITVKDDKGKETKVKVKDAAGVKVGEGIVVKDGKVAKEVKPKAGGY
jgi:hypothetical protein